MFSSVPWRLSIFALGFFLALSDLSLAAQLQQAPPRTIVVNLKDTTGPAEPFFDLSGSDYPGTLIRDDSQAQLKTTVDELGFRYIRFHAIFHDFLGTVQVEAGKTIYNWSGMHFLSAQTSSPSAPPPETNNDRYPTAANPTTTGPLPGHGLAQHPFLYCGEWNYVEPNQTIVLVRHGKAEWTYSIPNKMMIDGKPQMAELGDCTRFSNGNILFSYRLGAAIVTPQKHIIWDYRAAPNTEIHSAQPAGKNRVLLAQNGAPTKLILINTSSGKVEKELALPTPYPNKVHVQVRRAHLTKAGTYLVGLMEENRVAEFNADGKEVWSYTTPDPQDPVYPISAWDAVRLKNGNTLISGDEHAYVLEVDPKGEIVWQLGKNELPGYPLDVVQEVGRLADGNTVIANWVAGNVKPANWPSTIQIIEVTPDKKVVWALRQWKDPDLGPASSIQLLDQPGHPENGDLQR